MRRDRCGGCGADRLEAFLDLGKTPLADRFPATPDEPEDTWPLEVAVCTACWLVQLLEVVPDEVLWADYGFYSGASPSKVAEHEALAAELLATYPDQAKRGVVEIGCNDGDLLRHFQATGSPTLGIDPAEGPARVAEERGLGIVAAPFTRKLAAQVEPSGLVIARNVAAHVADLGDFFGGIAGLLAPDGVAVVEVQYLADLLAGNQFDHVYHEHRFFFSVGSLAAVAERVGLGVRSVEHVAAQGGSIRVTFHAGESTDDSWHWRRFETRMLDRGALHAMQGRAVYLRQRLRDLLNEERRAGHRIVGYGATAKSTTLLNFCGIGPDLLEWVEDTTPAKIGRFTPGTHIPIRAPGPERIAVGTWLVLAWNYLPGILQREWTGMQAANQRLLVPIPVPVVL